MKKAGRDRLNDDGLKDFGAKKLPITRYMESVWGRPVPIVTGRFREGVAFRGDQLGRWIVSVKWAANTESTLMNVVEQLKENYGEAEKLWEGYEYKLAQFRSSVKNDVTSLEASARKTTEAVNKVLSAYSSVIACLNSAEMQNATENAERLATAMQALANLQSHKLSIAVVDNSPE